MRSGGSIDCQNAPELWLTPPIALGGLAEHADGQHGDRGHELNWVTEKPERILRVIKPSLICEAEVGLAQKRVDDISGDY